jgi:hypothetical protein
MDSGRSAPRSKASTITVKERLAAAREASERVQRHLERIDQIRF